MAKLTRFFYRHLHPFMWNTVRKSSSIPNSHITSGNPVLTESQTQFYEDNGYLLIPKCVPNDALDKYRKRFEDICSDKVFVPGIVAMKDITVYNSKSKPQEKQDQKDVTRVNDFENDPILFGYCQLPQILKYVEHFIGANIMTFKTMFINKPPDTGSLSSRHPMHQDLHYPPIRPHNLMIACWTALDKATKENGCLAVVPGSHKQGLLPHEYPNWEGGVNWAHHGVKGYDSSHPRIHIEMEPGDTLLFNTLLFHGSGANKTNGFRKAINCHFASSECYFIDVAGTSQEHLAQEYIRMVKKKTGRDVTYIDFWREKGRVVQGQKMAQ